jgi:hypothetical protein
MLRVQTTNLHSWRSLFRTTRASLGVLLIAGVGLVLPSQTGDELVALSDMRMGPIPGVFRLQFALGALAVCAWYWARAALAARFGVDDTLEARAGLEDHRRAAFDAVPRIVFLAGVLLGVFLLWRGFSWTQAASVAVWAVPGYLLIHWRLALTSPRSRSQSINLRTLRSQRHPIRWLKRIGPRLRALLHLAPFGPWVSVPLMGAGLLAFVWGVVEGYVPWARNHAGLPALAAAAFPGPSVALIGFALMIGPLTALVFAMDGLRVEGRFLGRGVGLSRPPVLGALVLWSLFAPLLFSLHTVRVVSEQQGGIARVQQRQSLSAMLRDWASVCAPDPSQPVRPIIVAISGGASRAGIWGAQVLAAVDAAAGRGNAAVFAVSSVSGGSLGAAAYMAVKQVVQPRCGRPSTVAAEALSRLNNDHLGGDALGPLLAGALLADTPRALFAPVAAVVRLAAHLAPRGGDRAEALERAFERLWHEDLAQAGMAKVQGFPEFSAPFLSLAYDTTGGLRPGMPLWIVNGTDVSTGGRMLTAPFSTEGDAEWPFRASSDVLGILGADVEISTAINNGARFPYLEPSGELLPVDTPTTMQEQMRGDRPELVDGGYFDNEGLQTALELADWLRRQKVGQQEVRPILIQATANADIDAAVRATVVRCPNRPVDQPTRLPTSPHTLQLLTPVIGLYNVRGAHAAVLLREVRDRYCQAAADGGEDRSFFHFYLFNSPDRDIPLNWLLSPAIVDTIRAQLTLPPRAEMASDNGNDTEYANLRNLLDGFAAAGASAWRVNAEQQDVR